VPPVWQDSFNYVPPLPGSGGREMGEGDRG
jgi:hypothetical protein